MTTVRELDGTVDEADWIRPGHVLEPSEVSYLRSLHIGPQPTYHYEATTVVVPVTEHPGQVRVHIGSDPIVVALSIAQAVQLAGDLLIGVETAIDAQENPWT